MEEQNLTQMGIFAREKYLEFEAEQRKMWKQGTRFKKLSRMDKVRMRAEQEKEKKACPLEALKKLSRKL